MACSLYDRTIRYIVLEISCSVSEVVWLNSFLVAISSEAIHIRVWKYTSIIFKRIARFQSRSGGRNTTCHYCRLNSGVLWSERLRQLSEWHRKWLQTDIELRVGEKLSIISTNQGFIPLISAGLHGEINERGDGKIDLIPDSKTLVPWRQDRSLPSFCRRLPSFGGTVKCQ